MITEGILQPQPQQLIITFTHLNTHKHTHTHTHKHTYTRTHRRGQSICEPANVRQRLPSAAETDGYAAELSLLTRVARSINTSAQHTQTTSRVPASEEGKSESQIL